MLKTTLKELRKARACTDRYTLLRKGLGANYGDSTPITMTQILDLNGLDDCLWAILNTQNGKADKLLRLFARDCTKHVLPIYEKHYPNDPRVQDCIAVARRSAIGEVTEQAQTAARTAAWGAARDAAGDAAWADAWDVAAAARADAWDAAEAAGDAERQWQANRLRELLDEVQEEGYDAYTHCSDR